MTGDDCTQATDRDWPAGDEWIALLGAPFEAPEVQRIFRALGLDPTPMKPERDSAWREFPSDHGVTIGLRSYDEGPQPEVWRLERLDIKREGARLPTTLPYGLVFSDKKKDVHRKLGEPTSAAYWDNATMRCDVTYERGVLASISIRPPERKREPVVVRAPERWKNKSLLDVVQELVPKSIEAYRDHFFLCGTPAVKPVEVRVVQDEIEVRVSEDNLTVPGKLSALPLIGEEYWRRAHDMVAIHSARAERGRWVFRWGRSDLFEQIREEYLAAIHALLNEGRTHEATLCFARLTDAIGANPVEIDPQLQQRFSAETRTELNYFTRSKKTIARKFDGRKAASHSVLLSCLLSNTPMHDIIARRDLFDVAIESLLETSALKVKELLLSKNVAAIADPDLYVQEVARVCLDAIASKLVDDRAYEEALPVVELAIERHINLPLQYARRWECKRALGRAEDAEQDWDRFRKYFDQILQRNAIPIESDLATVWNATNTRNAVNWRRFRRGRLKNILFCYMRLLDGKSPIGSIPKGRTKKVLSKDAVEYRKSAQRLVDELRQYPELVRDSAKDHRLHNKKGVCAIRLPCDPYWAAESVAIDKYIAEMTQVP